MLRRYLEAAGTDLGGRDPVALVPVSVRREDEQDAGGNRISTVFVDLPVHEADPAERIRVVSDADAAAAPVGGRARRGDDRRRQRASRRR